MDGGNLREDAPETFDNRFDLYTIFFICNDTGFKMKAIY